MFEASQDLSGRMVGFSFPCESCDIVYSSMEDLKTHRRCRHGREEFTCDICYNRCKNLIDLTDHLLRCHGKQFKHLCFECGRGFQSVASFNNHKRLFHRPDLKCPVCDICKKIFPFESNLRYHKITHSQVREFYCNGCGKAFKHKHSLKEHHSGSSVCKGGHQ